MHAILEELVYNLFFVSTFRRLKMEDNEY